MNATERRAMRARLEAVRAETISIVQRGTCPQCGSALRRNLALAGWYQCEQYGAEGFRARSHEPQCSWQGFTQ